MSDSVNSVTKAMKLLDILARERRPLSLRELAEYSSYPKSTVHGLISALRCSGMVEQSYKDGKYMLGLHLFELGNCVRNSMNIAALSRNYMNTIASKTGESVNLAMIDDGEVLILEQSDNGSPLRVVAEQGTRLPVHSTSIGKALLAFMPMEKVKLIIQERLLIQYTPHTITDMDKMFEELENIKKIGYAIENGENRIGLRSVAAPIFDSSGNAVYALSVIGMYRSTAADSFKFAIKLVTESAAEISKNLGYGSTKFNTCIN